MRTICLDGEWRLFSMSKEHKIENVKMNIPGDVHSSLIREKLIPDPYWDCNERVSDWVHFVDFYITREFEVNDLNRSQRINIVLEEVDIFTTIYINDKEALKTNSLFCVYIEDVKKYLKEGKNTIKVVFHSPANEGAARAKTIDYYIPWAEGNNQIPNMNMIRTAQFHSGWDWGPAIIPIGIYQSVLLIFVDDAYITGIKTLPEGDEITFNVHAELYNDCKGKEIEVMFNNSIQKKQIGSITSFKFSTKGLEKWWTNDLGKQVLYPVTAKFNNQEVTKKIGIRTLELKREKDEHGESFKFTLNGVEFYGRGANMIPPDGLPERCTFEKTREILTDARAANMNMLRVWGGGYYLPDYFYDLCDEIGILLWHDLMFACAQYPTTAWFLEEVEHEMIQQTLRLQSHPCIALWCGDNEVFRSISWLKGAKNREDFFKAEYKKLNLFLKEKMESLDTTRSFWLGSPSKGDVNAYMTNEFESETFTVGDSHYWLVWHGDLDFSGFRLVKPRFCSEFGFQSYPSYSVVKTFTPPGTDSLKHPAFDAHQKSAGGNAKIFSMFDKYFKVPTDFKEILYLSQVQQAMAIRSGVEYWRQIKHICSGALFWQLNDLWPVSSWSSVEYGGRWKQLMYHAKHFFEPQAISFMEESDRYLLYFINDLPNDSDVSFSIRFIRWDGSCAHEIRESRTCKPLKAEILHTLYKDKLPVDSKTCFMYAQATVNRKKITCFILFDVYKNCSYLKPNISTKFSFKDNQTLIEVSTDKPAFFVTLEHENVRVFSDNSFVLLPNENKIVECEGKINSVDVYYLK